MTIESTKFLYDFLSKSQLNAAEGLSPFFVLFTTFKYSAKCAGR